MVSTISSLVHLESLIKEVGKDTQEAKTMLRGLGMTLATIKGIFDNNEKNLDAVYETTFKDSKVEYDKDKHNVEIDGNTIKILNRSVN